MSRVLLSRKTEAAAQAAKTKAASTGLRIGTRNDSFGREADRAANGVMAGETPPWSLSRIAMGTPLQRKCACGGSGECDACGEERKVQKKPQLSALADAQTRSTASLPAAVRTGVESAGRPLDTKTRRDMEQRFGVDFSQVRIHSGAQAAESARAVDALAYTTGRDIVFGSGKFEPHTSAGRKLLAHELAHVVQQRAAPAPAATEAGVQRSSDGGYRIAVAPVFEAEHLEQQADAAAERATGKRDHAPLAKGILSGMGAKSLAVQRVRIPVPNKPLCGKTLTHVDVLPPAVKDLEPCLPRGVPVTRINIVGRDLTKPSPGMGSQVFNLHIGYYKDATGRYCVVVRDSKACVAPPCLFLGCFPTLKEVLDAIVAFIRKILPILGLIALAILIALIIALLGPILVPVPALVSNQGDPGSGGGEHPAVSPTGAGGGPKGGGEVEAAA